MRTTPRGLTVWNLTTDQFDHNQLAANWDLIDSLLGNAPQSVESLSALPTSNLFVGRLVLLTAADGGFQPFTLVKYNGAAWQPVNQIEIQPAVPSSGNFGGRVVILSAASGGFPAWAIIRYDGSAWGIVGGWQTVNTGGGSGNISGLQSTGDVYISDPNRGFVLVDRSNGNKYRLYFTNSNLAIEQVT